MTEQTLTEKLTATYEKDFNSRFENEITRGLERVLGGSPLCKEFLNFTATLPLARGINEVIKSHEVILELKRKFINARLSEAANFINQGAQNGT